jgi:serine/threonine-protein kinase RsbW
MQISFSLCLPREGKSVPIVRHICRDALLKLGVDDGCVGEIEIAVTEACTNVLDHAHDTSEEYDVSVQVTDDRCEIRVIDTGSGFDGRDAGFVTAGDSAESGRGIFLMRAMVDDLSFVSEPEVGTAVHLVKRLQLEEDSILRVSSAGSSNGRDPAARPLP